MSKHQLKGVVREGPLIDLSKCSVEVKDEQLLFLLAWPSPELDSLTCVFKWSLSLRWKELIIVNMRPYCHFFGSDWDNAELKAFADSPVLLLPLGWFSHLLVDQLHRLLALLLAARRSNNFLFLYLIRSCRFLAFFNSLLSTKVLLIGSVRVTLSTWQRLG